MEAITRQGSSFELAMRKDMPTWEPAPYLPKEHTRRLKALNPHLEWRWDGAFPHWQVWFNDRIDMPYIVHRVQDQMGQFQPIDNRVYDDVRKSLWWSQKAWRERAHILDEMRKKEQMSHEADVYDTHYQMGKEIAPLVRTLADARGSSHGKSVNMWQGANLND